MAIRGVMTILIIVTITTNKQQLGLLDNVCHSARSSVDFLVMLEEDKRGRRVDDRSIYHQSEKNK